MSRRKRIALALGGVILCLLFSSALFGWPWSTDMFYSQAVKPFEEAPLAPPEDALAVDGEVPLDRTTAEATLSNPVPATAEAIARGRALYHDYCFPCHGAGARGDGPVAAKFIPPPNLLTEGYRNRGDGFFFAVITSGGPLMPAQGPALDPEERWAIILYLRSLQKP